MTHKKSSIKDFKQALRDRGAKIKAKALAKESKLSKKAKAPKEPVSELVPGSIEQVTSWVKQTWSEDAYNRFKKTLDKYPKFAESPYRLFQWTVILEKSEQDIDIIYDQEIIQGIRLNCLGKVDREVNEKWMKRKKKEEERGLI